MKILILSAALAGAPAAALTAPQASNLDPLAAAFAGQYRAFLPKQTYPIRVGTHPNTAFGIAFALDYARATNDKPFEALLLERAKAYFGGDKDYPAAWEPGGEDFF